MLHEIVNRCPNAEDDVQYSCDPYELLGEHASQGEISPREDQGDDEDEYEKHDGVGIE